VTVSRVRVLNVTGSSEDPDMVILLDRQSVTGLSEIPFFSLRDPVLSDNPVTAGAALTGFSDK
jgi:hypothetical protein